jgi:hypothetical protein
MDSTILPELAAAEQVAAARQVALYALRALVAEVTSKKCATRAQAEAAIARVERLQERVRPLLGGPVYIDVPAVER